MGATPHSYGGEPPQRRSVERETNDVTLKLGDRLENYLIEGVLGRGAQGEVFLARDVVLDRPVAVKVLGAATRDHANAFHEARLIATLDHPNIVRVYHVAVSSGIWYMAMEYLDGGNVRTLVRRRGALEVVEALRFMIPICDAVAHAHEIGVIHRDIKPHNMLVSRASVVKLADFGLARLGEDMGGSFIGTPEWVAPEIWKGGPATTRSDIYSLGASFYYMMTGEPPFLGTNLESLQRAHIKQPVTIPAYLPGTIRNVLHSCLAKNPADRPASARLLLEYLEAAREEITIGRPTRKRSAATTTQEPVQTITEEDRIAGDLAVMEVTRIADLRAELSAALTGARPLVAFHGHAFGLRTKLIRTLFDGQPESFHVVARVVLVDDDDSLLYVLAERLDVSAKDVTGLYQEIIAACVGGAVARSGTRTVIHLHAERPLKSAEIGAFVELARRARKFNLTCLLVCSSDDVRAIAAELEADGTADLLRTVAAPPATFHDASNYIEAWTSAATADDLRWTGDAKRLALSLSQDGQNLPYIVHNACAYAMTEAQRLVTSWCVTQAVRLGNNFAAADDLVQNGSAKPTLWPDAENLPLLRQLRQQYAME